MDNEEKLNANSIYGRANINNLIENRQKIINELKKSPNKYAYIKKQLYKFHINLIKYGSYIGGKNVKCRKMSKM